MVFKNIRKLFFVIAFSASGMLQLLGQSQPEVKVTAIVSGHNIQEQTINLSGYDDSPDRRRFKLDWNGAKTRVLFRNDYTDDFLYLTADNTRLTPYAEDVSISRLGYIEMSFLNGFTGYGVGGPRSDSDFFSNIGTKTFTNGQAVYEYPLEQLRGDQNWGGGWNGRTLTIVHIIRTLPLSFDANVIYDYGGKQEDQGTTKNLEFDAANEIKFGLAAPPVIYTDAGGNKTLNANGDNAVTPQTRHFYQPADLEFWSGRAASKARRKKFLNPANATLNPRNIVTEDRAELKWVFTKHNINLYDTEQFIQFNKTPPSEFPSEWKKDTPIAGVLPTLTLSTGDFYPIFRRPSIFFDNTGSLIVDPVDQSNAPWVGRPIGLKYEFKNAKDASIYKKTNLNPLSYFIISTIAGNFSESDLIDSGSITWIYELTQNSAALKNISINFENVNSDQTTDRFFVFNSTVPSFIKIDGDSTPLSDGTQLTTLVNEQINVTCPQTIYFPAMANGEPDKNNATTRHVIDGSDRSSRYKAEITGYSVSHDGDTGSNITGVNSQFTIHVQGNTKITLNYEWYTALNILPHDYSSSSTVQTPTSAGVHWISLDETIRVKAGRFHADGENVRAEIIGYRITKNGNQNDILLSDTDGDEGTSPVIDAELAFKAIEKVDFEWIFEGQVKYSFSQSYEEGSQRKEPNLSSLPFLEIKDGNGAYRSVALDKSSDGLSAWIRTGTATNPQAVRVGTRYRTQNGCWTLADFTSVPTGDLRFPLISKDISLLADVATGGTAIGGTAVSRRVLRYWQVNEVETPTHVNWHYKPTVYRAEIALGQSFNPKDDSSSLIPNLCNSATLGELNPEDLNIKEVKGSNALNGQPALRWDRKRKELFPVCPGSYQVEWPGVDGQPYTIEIVSGFPTTTEELATASEDIDGLRTIDLDGANVMQTSAFPAISNTFPASPVAHYNHLFHIDEPIPTNLDQNPSDEWSFKELTFKTNDAQVVENLYTASSDGLSVLLFSKRPDSRDIANGDVDKEELAVRIVKTVNISDGNTIAANDPNEAKLVLGSQALKLGTSKIQEAQYKIISKRQPYNGDDCLVDFWFNINGIQAEDPPVELITLSAGSPGPVNVTVNSGDQTLQANYGEVTVTCPLPKDLYGWHHCVLHIFDLNFLGLTTRVLNLYLDEKHSENVHMGDPSPMGQLNTTNLEIGKNALPEQNIQIDQLRLFDLAGDSGLWLDPFELENLRKTKDFSSTPFRGTSPILQLDFEAPETDGPYQDIKVGSIDDSSLSQPHLQEVATRITSTLDNAGFNGSGRVLFGVSNYNANLHDRTADVGSWGPIFPVNSAGIINNGAEGSLQVTYFENLYRVAPTENPNVAWAYINVKYNDIVFPQEGPHKDKRIYIASRVGSEGVNKNGRPQEIFSPSRYSDLSIYNQPDSTMAGYNPNEEHALVAPSNQVALKIKREGEDIPNTPPPAAFALQYLFNGADTSNPWVLVQFNNLTTGLPDMAAYKVEKDRSGELDFPRPDEGNNLPIGLRYDDASNPEDRFLNINPDGVYPFEYTFDYSAYAGDLLLAPYPVNRVIGNLTMFDSRGANSNQRVLWRDVNRNPWTVSGGGHFTYRFFYPLREDFYTPTTIPPGTPIAWLPSVPNEYTGDNNPATIDIASPHQVKYTTFWRSDYPKVKRGESITYQGGEYFNENPGSKGLPAVVGMAASEVIYDSATPRMVIDDSNRDKYSYRVIRALDRREVDLSIAQMRDFKFSPSAVDKIFTVGERWYFKKVAGSLQKRFYFDSITEKLVFRGYLNNKDSGDPNLTAGPDSINILEPNIMTASEKIALKGLHGNLEWRDAIDKLYKKSTQPNEVRKISARGKLIERPNLKPSDFLAGLREHPQISLAGTIGNDDLKYAEEVRETISSEIDSTWENSQGGEFINETEPSNNSTYIHLNSLGTGSALVPNPAILTRSTTETTFVTIAENNDSSLGGAPVSLHVIEILPDRFRGSVKVIEGADAFSEKITIQHNGDFGANTGDLYYEWWIRDAVPIEKAHEEILRNGTLRALDPSNGETAWQQYLPKDVIENSNIPPSEKNLGLHSIVFEGNPNVTLSDKMVLMRYRHKSETSWKLIQFEISDPKIAWGPGFNAVPAPFQWAGAANSPQIQADGSKRYIPQLIMGWVKRILDRINPYEARYTNFFNNLSPATYSSQVQIAGAPYAGPVALNQDKDVIENTGLIELYETILERARELSIDNSTNPVTSDGINQAILLAATRLSLLYEILAQESYTDAQDSTITIHDDEDLLKAASFTHAFQNFQPDLLHEELALLRGTDFRKSFPVYNRMFWNYAKGLGEAAYNSTYSIYDENTDGFINEDDARALFPQGHGDAWGHFLSALGMHYTLLQQPVFSWKARPELYALMDNVLEVDFLDEKTFARIAAAKARAGREIVRNTYRLHYTQDPDGQWQGYTDGVDKARAWGVSEWGARTGQAALFDWAVANALLPEIASGPAADSPADGLERIERSVAEDEISGIATGFIEIQAAIDQANKGVNPLGFDTNALSFDLDLEDYENSSGNERITHFEQIYNRAVEAGTNAETILRSSSRIGNKLQNIAGDSEAMIVESLRQDMDFRNRLISIFGQPFEGTIGPGQLYAEGYDGPDTQLFAYLPRTTITDIVPQSAKESESTPTMVRFQPTISRVSNLADNFTIRLTYDDVFGNEVENAISGFIPFGDLIATGLGVNSGASDLKNAFQVINDTDAAITYDDFRHIPELEIPVRQRSKYAFQAMESWGQRRSYGELQRILEDDLQTRINLESSIRSYVHFLRIFEANVKRLESEIKLLAHRRNAHTLSNSLKQFVNTKKKEISNAQQVAKKTAKGTIMTLSASMSALPGTVGTSNDPSGPGRAGIKTSMKVADIAITSGNWLKELAIKTASGTLQRYLDDLKHDEILTKEIASIEASLIAISEKSSQDGQLRLKIGNLLQTIEMSDQNYRTTLTRGFSLMKEREAFNKILAAKAQKNRYQDLSLRLARNEAMTKYQNAFQHAARFAWMAAKAYDYETALSPQNPASATQILDEIVRERQLGLWELNMPQSGNGGLSEILHQLNTNFQLLKGQLGINNPQSEEGKISLRKELFRIGSSSSASDTHWSDALKARQVDNLNQISEFKRYCRPIPGDPNTPQPGLVIRFPTNIEVGKNIFGLPLSDGDHSFSSANYATKIRSFGVWLENYSSAQLATTPRAYLVPIGNDYLRTSENQNPITRTWNIVDQRIPTPFILNQKNLKSSGFVPLFDDSNGSFTRLRRHGDFRIYHDSNGMSEEELVLSSRLIGRSVWNSEWLLIIPGAGLHADPNFGLTQLTDHISDIKIHFETYSHQGQ